MAEPIKPRALTYTEMMNDGRQQMDEAEHAREQELQQRVDALKEDVDQLERSAPARPTSGNGGIIQMLMASCKRPSAPTWSRRTHCLPMLRHA